MRTCKFVALPALACALVFGFACSKEEHESTPVPAPTWTNPQLLWSPQKLATELQTPTEPFVLVDCRDAQSEFDAGHIPGAIWLSWKSTIGSPYMHPYSTIENNLSVKDSNGNDLTLSSKIVVYSEVDPPCN